MRVLRAAVPGMAERGSPVRVNEYGGQFTDLTLIHPI